MFHLGHCQLSFEVLPGLFGGQQWERSEVRGGEAERGAATQDHCPWSDFSRKGHQVMGREERFESSDVTSAPLTSE